MRGHWREYQLEDTGFSSETEERRERLCEVEFLTRQPEELRLWNDLAEGLPTLSPAWVLGLLGALAAVLWLVW
jgi:hypothetical protein